MSCRGWVFTLVLTGWATGLQADEPIRVLTPAATAPQKQAQLQIRLIERALTEEPQSKGESKSRVLDRAETKAFLEKLQGEPRTSILAAPTLRLPLGEKGSLRNGGEVLRDLPASNGNPPMQERVFFGTAVDATVTMPKPGLLSVNFSCEQSDLIRTDKTSVPGITKRAVQTRVEMQPGQTVVLQGLKCTRDVVTETRVPVLGEIPVIGEGLFAKRQTDKQSYEMVVMVTAELVEEPAK